MSIMSVIQGSSGKFSLMRFASLVVVLSVMGIFVAHNIVAMVHGQGFVCIGFQEATLVAAVLGAKAYQAYGEHRSNANGNGRGNENNSPTTADLPVDKKE